MDEPSQLLHEFENLLACRVRLLLIGLGGDDARVLELEERTHALVLSNRSVIDIRRVGREKKPIFFTFAGLKGAYMRWMGACICADRVK